MPAIKWYAKDLADGGIVSRLHVKEGRRDEIEIEQYVGINVVEEAVS